MSDGFEGCWKALETHPMVEDAESLAREAWKMGRDFGKGDTVMVTTTRSQVDEYLAENGLVAVPVEPTEATTRAMDRGIHSSGCVTMHGRMSGAYKAMIAAAKEDV